VYDRPDMGQTFVPCASLLTEGFSAADAASLCGHYLEGPVPVSPSAGFRARHAAVRWTDNAVSEPQEHPSDPGSFEIMPRSAHASPEAAWRVLALLLRSHSADPRMMALHREAFGVLIHKAVKARSDAAMVAAEVAVAAASPAVGSSAAGSGGGVGPSRAANLRAAAFGRVEAHLIHAASHPDVGVAVLTPLLLQITEERTAEPQRRALNAALWLGLMCRLFHPGADPATLTAASARALEALDGGALGESPGAVEDNRLPELLRQLADLALADPPSRPALSFLSGVLRRTSALCSGLATRMELTCGDALALLPGAEVCFDTLRKRSHATRSDQS
jgi:hypothetical protein